MKMGKKLIKETERELINPISIIDMATNQITNKECYTYDLSDIPKDMQCQFVWDRRETLYTVFKSTLQYNFINLIGTMIYDLNSILLNKYGIDEAIQLLPYDVYNICIDCDWKHPSMYVVKTAEEANTLMLTIKEHFVPRIMMKIFDMIHVNIATEFAHDPDIYSNINNTLSNIFDLYFGLFYKLFLTVLNQANTIFLEPGFPNVLLNHSTNEIEYKNRPQLKE